MLHFQAIYISTLNRSSQHALSGITPLAPFHVALSCSAWRTQNSASSSSEEMSQDFEDRIRGIREVEIYFTLLGTCIVPLFKCCRIYFHIWQYISVYSSH